MGQLQGARAGRALASGVTLERADVRAQAVSRGGERVRAERGAGPVEALRSGPDRAEVRASGVLGRCEAGAGEGRAEEGVKRAGRK